MNACRPSFRVRHTRLSFAFAACVPFLAVTSAACSGPMQAPDAIDAVTTDRTARETGVDRDAPDSPDEGTPLDVVVDATTDARDESPADVLADTSASETEVPLDTASVDASDATDDHADPGDTADLDDHPSPIDAGSDATDGPVDPSDTADLDDHPSPIDAGSDATGFDAPPITDGGVTDDRPTALDVTDVPTTSDAGDTGTTADAGLPVLPCTAEPGARTSDAFDSLAAWTVVSPGTAGGASSSPGCGRNGSACLSIDYRGGTEVKVQRAIATGTRSLVRLWFYDDAAATRGSLALLDNGTDGTHVGIGVDTSIDATHYVVRIDTRAATRSSGVTRSVGWHLFEWITTPSGTFVKVDNQLLDETVFVNVPLAHAARVSIVSTWDLPAVSRYDDFEVYDPDLRPWREQACSVLGHFAETYRATDFSGLYPTLGDQGNDIRSFFDTAHALYVWGRATGDTAAVSRGLALYRDGLAYGRFATVGDWGRGASLRPFVAATRALASDLTATDRAAALRIATEQVAYYLDLPYVPQSGWVNDSKAEENAWHAGFLMMTASVFPDVPRRAEAIALARCFAYHSITRSTDAASCGRTTQTVYDDYRLDNHNRASPTYAFSTFTLLGEGHAVARLDAPSEDISSFVHNVAGLWGWTATQIHPVTFGVLETRDDWTGATATAQNGPFALAWLESVGVSTGITMQALFESRSLFFRGIVNDLVDGPVARIDVYRQVRGEPGYVWLQNGTMVGNSILPLVEWLP